MYNLYYMHIFPMAVFIKRFYIPYGIIPLHEQNMVAIVGKVFLGFAWVTVQVKGF